MTWRDRWAKHYPRDEVDALPPLWLPEEGFPRDSLHLDGISWLNAPIPKVKHDCQVQTKGWMSLRRVERCACGAIRLDGYGPWMERNSRQPMELLP